MDRIRDRSDQECLYNAINPPTHYRGFPHRSFYMVAKEPITGCVATVSSSSVSGSCCEQDVAPWGSFLPVWSPGHGRIYKNRLYAECHGVSDYEVWDAIHTCTEVHSFDSNLSGCNVYFEFPGELGKVRSERCVMDMFATCPGDFVVNYEVVGNFTKQDIVDGCQSDFVSIYETYTSVKNVYCYICMEYVRSIPVAPCHSSSDGKSSDMSAFINYLSREYLTYYRPGQNTMQDKACEMFEDIMVCVFDCIGLSVAPTPLGCSCGDFLLHLLEDDSTYTPAEQTSNGTHNAHMKNDRCTAIKWETFLLARQYLFFPVTNGIRTW